MALWQLPVASLRFEGFVTDKLFQALQVNESIAPV